MSLYCIQTVVEGLRCNSAEQPIPDTLQTLHTSSCSMSCLTRSAQDQQRSTFCFSPCTNTPLDSQCHYTLYTFPLSILKAVGVYWIVSLLIFSSASGSKLWKVLLYRFSSILFSVGFLIHFTRKTRACKFFHRSPPY